ncbi:hypothetical protein QCE62_19730 [Caballeronia sp. LZ033]|uniref:hypothetical protein n=1 Tax=Caballeronia sp. LZ033 TaxID=3038566 RepID=UPI0028559C4A|nr:hypothetical protein [Caballeronia sp. LZ033]MDR5815821.1 hypothetical protein [Caballeronia sp. LZ033]
MQNNSNSVLTPGDPPVALTPAEQKQIRDAMCGAAVRGLTYPGELADIRSGLSHQFSLLKADSSKAAKGKAS